MRLHLRPGVVFSDGRPLTASAVKAALERSIRLSRDVMPAAFTAIEGDPGLSRREGVGAVAGIEAVSEEEVRIRLDHPVPILPSLLTDGRTAIAAAGSGARGHGPVGTGPFRTVLHTPERARSSNATRGTGGPRARASTGSSSAPPSRRPEIAEGLRSGELDVARDLLPRDLEAILRESRFRGGLVETPKKNTYFAVFHAASPAVSNAGPADGPGRSRADAGLRLGRARPLRPAGDGRHSAGNPRPRSRAAGSPTSPARRPSR